MRLIRRLKARRRRARWIEFTAGLQRAQQAGNLTPGELARLTDAHIRAFALIEQLREDR